MYHDNLMYNLYRPDVSRPRIEGLCKTSRELFINLLLGVATAVNPEIG
jgi:hypothetical protein